MFLRGRAVTDFEFKPKARSLVTSSAGKPTLLSVWSAARPADTNPCTRAEAAACSWRPCGRNGDTKGHGPASGSSARLWLLRWAAGKR